MSPQKKIKQSKNDGIVNDPYMGYMTRKKYDHIQKKRAEFNGNMWMMVLIWIGIALLLGFCSNNSRSLAEIGSLISLSLGA